MPNARIEFPQSTALAKILKFGIELDYYLQHDRLIIELPDKVFCGPFAMLFIATKLRMLKKRAANLEIIFNNIEPHEYLAHMGFFSMCGLKFGRETGEAWGSQNYLPITKLTRDEFYEEDVDKYEELPDLIQRHVDRLSEVVSRDSNHKGAMFDVLSYSIREIFRNVFEHSESDSLFYCTQYWPKSDKVEFSVADLGIGIKRGLGLNPNFRFDTDKESLEYALLPSVSGKTHLPRVSENWFNSGYGLYMTNRLARNGGNFVIASGSSAIHLTQKTKNNYVTSFPGTILRVNLNVPEISDVKKRLSEFRKDGAKIAKQISGSGNRPPSAMSLLLRRDYQPKSTGFQ